MSTTIRIVLYKHLLIIFLSTYLSIHLICFLYSCIPIYFSIVLLSIYLSTYLHTYLLLHLSICLSIYQYFHLIQDLAYLHQHQNDPVPSLFLKNITDCHVIKSITYGAVSFILYTNSLLHMMMTMTQLGLDSELLACVCIYLFLSQ